ncbi:MAG: hypothetical protein ACI94Y_003582 [Maribacter sp.]|jgi:hypothetical protein
MRIKNTVKLLLIWIIIIVVLLEISLRLLGYQPMQIPYGFLQSTPKNAMVSDSILGMTLNPGKFNVTINHELKYTATHLTSRERITYKADSSHLNSIFIYGCSYTYGTAFS